MDKIFALDHEKWRRNRINDIARKGFEKRPLPSKSWQDLPPASKILWPYCECEARAITANFPKEELRQIALEKVIDAARQWIREEVTEYRGRADPRKEILQLRRGMESLFEALMNLSPGAHQHLLDKMRPFRTLRQKPWTPDELRYALDRFDYENRWGLNELPAPTSRGPRIRDHEARLWCALDNAFASGHGGQRARRGWPAFLKACVGPLKDFGMLHREDKSWQDTLRKRRKVSREI
jgi:hypothetical protein